MLEDTEGLYELFANPSLFGERVDTCVFDRQGARDGLHDGLSGILVFWP